MSTTENSNSFDAAYWNNRYIAAEIGWDLNGVSPPIQAYVSQLTDKNKSILIAGCGNAYEAEFLFSLGFRQITLVDISNSLVDKLKLKLQHTTINIICQDIFEHFGQYDLILEQTLFCAIDPTLRPNYVLKMHELLNEKGKLVGLLFDKEFNNPFPPFGGNKSEYIELFTPYFNFNTFQACYNSILPRQGTELFINFSIK
jgi:SAM-dependent methyltransferase